MQHRTHAIFLLFFALITAASCNTSYQPQTAAYNNYRVTDSSQKNKALLALLKPYADSVNKNMNDVVAVAAVDLEKKQPEGRLGNMMVDALLIKAKEIYGADVAGAFFNNGGQRLPVIPKGEITRGKIFELSPFDNYIVLLKLPGTVLQQFINHVSSLGGWPAAGVTWQIKNKQALNIKVNGQPLNQAAVYAIATIDYVANGGDDCNMLRPISQQNKGAILRDAIFEYLAAHTKQGKAVTAQIENRVTNAE